MTYEELLAAHAALNEEVMKLRIENAQLRSRLGMEPSDEKREEPASPLSLQGRMDLFRSLFKGREDVFARRWYSPTSKKSGYQPVCANEWNRSLCDKKKYKCAECPNRRFSALSYHDVYKHLVGQDEHGCDVIGVYAILSNHTCNFLCVDFDDKSCEHGYKEDVTAFVRVCSDWKVACSVERSRSGNGAHVWMFFERPILAAKARKLGFTLLSEAMNRCGRISFKSFDRFFPNQDQVPEGGLGNLVALPLQGLARKFGNSVFVDENFQMYPDQWSYLQSVHRMTEAEVDAVLQAHHATVELSATSEDEPWRQPQAEPVRPHALPQRIHLHKSDRIYIPYENLPGGTVNYLRRLASFHNPEFYSRQALRLPTFATPRVITCSEMVQEATTGAKEVAMPRGCEEAVLEYFRQNKVEVQMDDRTTEGTEIDATFTGSLWREQAEAVESLIRQNTGVLSATTAFGKTVTAIGLIARLRVNTLILVHTQALQAQWIERLNEFLHIEYTPEDEPRKRGRKKKFSPFGTTGALPGLVDVITLQSCTSKEEACPLLQNYGMVIVDECHHISAVSFEQVLKAVTARRVYGLTATPIRKDGLQPIIFMQCGAIRYKADTAALLRTQTFERYLITRFTPYRNLTDEPRPFAEINRDLAECEARNQLIVEDVVTALKEGRTPIILTTLKSHVLHLGELLAPHCPHIIMLLGSDSAKEKRTTLERLHALPKEEPLIIIATGKYVGEGFDYPRLDTLFLVLPVSWKGIIAQYAGRLHREYDGKVDVRIYDYVDLSDPMCNKMYHRRLKGYAGIGYKYLNPMEGLFNEVTENIFNGKNFETPLLSAIRSALKTIVISAQKVQVSRLNSIVQALITQARRGVQVLVITTAQNQSVDFIAQHGIRVLHQKSTLSCAVIDGTSAWFGNIEFLGYTTVEENCIHITDAHLAMQLHDLLCQKSE